MRYNLNKLYDFARQNAVSFSLYYSEASDELELQIHSVAKAEEFYMKRVPSIDYFIEKWFEHVQNELSSSQ